MSYERLRRLAVMFSPLPSEGEEAVRGLGELLADFDRVVREKDDAAKELAVMTAARDEACDKIENALSIKWGTEKALIRQRIAELRRVGARQERV